MINIEDSTAAVKNSHYNSSIDINSCNCPQFVCVGHDYFFFNSRYRSLLYSSAMWYYCLRVLSWGRFLLRAGTPFRLGLSFPLPQAQRLSFYRQPRESVPIAVDASV